MCVRKVKYVVNVYKQYEKIMHIWCTNYTYKFCVQTVCTCSMHTYNVYSSMHTIEPIVYANNSYTLCEQILCAKGLCTLWCLQIVYTNNVYK